MEIDRLSKRGSDKFASLTATDDALDFIAETGFDAVYGARPLKRTIQREVETPLAKMILARDVNEKSKLKVHVVNDRLSVEIDGKTADSDKRGNAKSSEPETIVVEGLEEEVVVEEEEEEEPAAKA